MKLLLSIIFLMLTICVSTDGYAASDDEVLNRLSAIEERLSKIEKKLESGKAAEQLEALRNMFNAGKDTKKKDSNIKKEKAGKYLVVTKWSAGDGGQDVLSQQVVEIYYTAKNVANETISIVDGVVVFKDKLGETIGRLTMKRDIELAPGHEKALGGRYTQSFGRGLERLFNINKKHVVVSVELKKLMFGNGDVIKF